MARVDWSVEALRDIVDIRAYIRDRDEPAAERIAERLRTAGNSLSYLPRRGRPARNGTRELVHVRPYIIRYEVVGDDVTILSVRHSSRRPLPD